jgi:transcriptional regulator with XRE-family HTH domain
MNISDLIRIGRAKKNLSQTALAKRLGITPSAVSQWEIGDTVPSGEILPKLAVELDIVEELFPGYIKQVKSEIPNSSVTREELESLRREIEKLKKEHASAQKKQFFDSIADKGLSALTSSEREHLNQYLPPMFMENLAKFLTQCFQEMAKYPPDTLMKGVLADMEKKQITKEQSDSRKPEN